MAQYEFVLLGAGSDVAYRYVFPALAELEAANLLPRRFRIVAISRKNWTDIRRRIVEGVKTHRGNIGIGVVKKLLARVRHASADLTDPHQLKAVIGRLRGPLVLYFGLPPSISEIIVDYLHEIRLPPRSRVMMEKPFGQNRQSAEALNRKLLRFLSER
ncbi:MAG: hypothetical protein KF682_12140, partial [Nitrospira sp.]|nr:hypothetical protein [Nitrospira sp.]